ncbi:hypothetical protein [Paenibacillus caui]|uniref:hypothetical protein n=1 Tax=Paenibacillus caui TaxID=2873927 RepID=UPI001CA9C253|nr:hypothetical protein [Paenibacillus caui]
MSRAFKKVVLYGALLAAGAAIGMQLVSDNPSTDYNAQAQTAGYEPPAAGTGSGGTPAAVQGADGAGGAGSIYEQGTYVKLSNGQTYYYVQNRSQPTPGTAPSQTETQAVPQGGGSPGSAPGGGQSYQTPGQMLLQPSPQTAVDHFADKTGELLQDASQKSINWVVSLFGSLTN